MICILYWNAYQNTYERHKNIIAVLERTVKYTITLFLQKITNKISGPNSVKKRANRSSYIAVYDEKKF